MFVVVSWSLFVARHVLLWVWCLLLDVLVSDVRCSVFVV